MRITLFQAMYILPHSVSSEIKGTTSSVSNGSSSVGVVCSGNTTLHMCVWGRALPVFVSLPTAKENLVVNYLSLASFSDSFEQLPQGIMK